MFSRKSSQRNGYTIDTLVGPDVVIRGDLEFSGGLYVEGRVEGELRATPGKPASLVLAENGSIHGQVHAPVVVINGCMKGDVHYAVVEMSAGAQLTGRLVHAQPAAQRALPAPEGTPAAPKDKGGARNGVAAAEA